jgi:hypothetical protein
MLLALLFPSKPFINYLPKLKAAQPIRSLKKMQQASYKSNTIAGVQYEMY